MKVGAAAIDGVDAAHYRPAGWWSDRTLSQTAHHHTLTRPAATRTWYEINWAATILTQPRLVITDAAPLAVQDDPNAF